MVSPLDGSVGLWRHRVFSCSKPFSFAEKTPVSSSASEGFRGDWDSGLSIIQLLQSCSGESSKSAPAHPVSVYPAPVCLLLVFTMYFECIFPQF